jgi:hypothetical protein
MDDLIAAPATDISAPTNVIDQSAIDQLAIPEIDHYELDDVPLFHIPMAGATILTLAFGVGRADEPVTHGGMTHLAEHLILGSITDVFDHANGTTEPFRVTFVTRGSPRDVSKFLRDVCKAIEMPRLSKMHQEAKVLRTEAAGRGGMGLSTRMHWLRTGYQGIGAYGLPEYFLDMIDETRLRSWIATHFVAGNAAIWIAGEIPDDLEVLLPPGPKQATRDVRLIDGLETPTIVVEEAPGVGVAFDARRSAPVGAAFRSLTRQLTKRLRVDRGLGYEIGGDYWPVGPDRAFVNAWATCLPEATRDVQQIVLESIDDVASRGPAPDELSKQYQSFLQDMADPRSIPGRLDAHVRDVLLGDDPAPKSMASLIDEQWRLESEHVASAFKEVRESMLMLLPRSGVDPQRPFMRYPGPPSGSVAAERTFEFISKEKKRRFRHASSALTLSVGKLGVSVELRNRARISAVLWEDCVGVVVVRGIRTLLGRDGTALQVYESDWRDGWLVLRLVDKFAPKALIIKSTE